MAVSPSPQPLRLLVLTRYERLGASSRLRMLQFVEPLRAREIHCTVSPLLPNSYLERLYKTGTRSFAALVVAYLRRLAKLATVGRYDALWIEKELFPQLPATLERLLRLLGVRYVVDYDDAVFHNYDLSGSWIVRKLFGRKIDQVMRNATVVVAGNPYIAQRSKAAGARDVRLVPTVVEHRRYEMMRSAHQRPVTIGWIGSPATQAFVLNIADTLIALCHKYGCRLLLVGAQPSIAQHFSGADVEVRRWSEDNEQCDIADMDIGIMPLEDRPWERGKCGYKLIQYMATGMAVCASPVGVNVDIVCKSGAGLLAASQDEWREALTRLIVDVEERYAMGRCGRDAVARHYSVEAVLEPLTEIFRHVAGRR